MTILDTLVQRPFPGAEIEMYDIDLSSRGGPTLYFTNWVREDGTRIVWRGNTYDPVAMESVGYGVSGEGKPSRPTITISNTSTDSSEPKASLSALAGMYDSFIGCKITRWKTYRQFLDDGENADPATHFPLEVFEVSQLLEETFLSLKWELTVSLDAEGNMIPKGFMNQSFCPFTYRVFDAEADTFVYNNVSCPYEGEAMFDENGDITTDPSQDKCSHRLGTGCRKRYGTSNPLPFGGFPGMLRGTPR